MTDLIVRKDAMSRLPLPEPAMKLHGKRGKQLSPESMDWYTADQVYAYADDSNAALRRQLNAAKLIIAGQDERAIHRAREHGELMQRASDVAGERAANAILTDENAALRAELERLTAALAKANTQAEHFEREWYLRGDEMDRLTMERDALRAELGSLISQFHHAMNDAGWHPGRTDDNLCDVIREKGKEMEAMKQSWMMLAEASIEFAEHLKPEMSPQDAAMTVKLREIFDGGRKATP